MQLLDDVIRHFGSRSKLARALRINPSAINGWEKVDRISAKACLEIERLTFGKFKAMDLYFKKGRGKNGTKFYLKQH